MTLPPPNQPQAPPSPPPAGSGWTGGRVAGTAIGAVGVLVGLTLAALGTGLLVLDTAARDDAGYLMTDRTSLSTTTAALVEDDLELPVEGPSWISGPELLGTVRVEVTAAEQSPVLVGIASRAEVVRLLGGTAHDEVSETASRPTYTRVDGQRQGPDPTTAAWAAAQTGSDVELTWPAAEGNWALVVMNADGSPGVAVDVRAGGTVPHLDTVALTILASGVVILAGGAVATTLSLRAAVRTADAAGG